MPSYRILVTIPVDIMDRIKVLASNERRSWSNMALQLIVEALDARGRK